MDCAGSLTDEAILHLTTKKGFRVQGSAKDANRTILDNADQVGNNCLTYMETVNGLTIRCKFTIKWCKCWRAVVFEKPLGNTGKTGFVNQRSWFDSGRSHTFLQGYSSY